MPVDNIIIDGELVFLNENQHSDFQELQNAIKAGSENLFFYIFDILFYDNYLLTEQPLLKRKEILKNLMQYNDNPLLIYSDHLSGKAHDIYQKACELGLEGIIAKNVASVYTQGRDKNWLKIKCTKRQEFVIGGYLESSKNRKYFRSLMLGTYNKLGELVYHGNVGTGFNEKSLKDIYNLMAKLIFPKMPFSSKPPNSKNAIWLKPELVAEIEFTEWTRDGTLRHPSFKGIRQDKFPRQITKETEQPIETIVPMTLKKTKQIVLSNPQKILYPEDKITKIDLYNYYEEIHSWILPFIASRPLTLVRCPSTYHDCFFQKHIENNRNKNLYEIVIKEKNGKGKYIYIKDKNGLLALCQMGVLEIHTWGSLIENVENPNMIIFDLDPAPDVSWKKIVAAAFELRELLEKISLKCFVKTTGGKGLHVVVPIKPELEWDVVKEYTHTIVNFLVKENPNSYIGKMNKEERKGKIFIDYLRNSRGATAISPYSTRARIHAPISVPLEWDELTNKREDTFFTIKTLSKRLANLKKDPWKDFFKNRRSLKIKQNL